jgi:hypothetical protein
MFLEHVICVGQFAYIMQFAPHKTLPGSYKCYHFIDEQERESRVKPMWFLSCPAALSLGICVSLGLLSCPTIMSEALTSLLCSLSPVSTVPAGSFCT